MGPNFLAAHSIARQVYLVMRWDDTDENGAFSLDTVFESEETAHNYILSMCDSSSSTIQSVCMENWYVQEAPVYE